MELSTTRGATSCAATQELPSILLNPTVHHRIHKSSPLFLILSQTYPVHKTPSQLSSIQPRLGRRWEGSMEGMEVGGEVPPPL
jgi:hypothetical protein